MCFPSLYLPWVFCLSDRRQVFFYTECFVLCVFYTFCFCDKVWWERSCYCFAESSLVVVCACVLIDFHWNTTWRKTPVMTWFKGRTVFVGPWLSGVKSEQYNLLCSQHTSCHLAPYRIVAVNSSCCNRLEVIKDLSWATFGRYLILFIWMFRLTTGVWDVILLIFCGTFTIVFLKGTIND